VIKKYKIKKQYRYKGYDYSQGGFYFVTICAKNREMFFGDIKNEKMELSEIGVAADRCWQEIPRNFLTVDLDEYVVMPNHVHGIIIIRRNAPRRVPTECDSGLKPLIKDSLSSIVNHYKGGLKKFCNNNNLEFVWQPRFHDRIIRNEEELNRIRQYIIDNPTKWDWDRNNLRNV